MHGRSGRINAQLKERCWINAGLKVCVGERFSNPRERSPGNDRAFCPGENAPVRPIPARRGTKFRRGWRPMPSLRWVDENVLAQPAISADHDFSPSIKRMV
jgi:hypothetical protein